MNNLYLRTIKTILFSFISVFLITAFLGCSSDGSLADDNANNANNTTNNSGTSGTKDSGTSGTQDSDTNTTQKERCKPGQDPKTSNCI